MCSCAPPYILLGNEYFQILARNSKQIFFQIIHCKQLLWNQYSPYFIVIAKVFFPCKSYVLRPCSISCFFICIRNDGGLVNSGDRTVTAVEFLACFCIFWDSLFYFFYLFNFFEEGRSEHLPRLTQPPPTHPTNLTNPPPPPPPRSILLLCLSD